MATESLKVIIEASNQTKGAFRSASRDVNSFADNVEHAQGSLQGLATAGTVGLIGFGTAIGFAIKQASDLTESINAVQTTFEEAAGTVLAFSKTAATSAGLSREAFNQAVTPIGAMLRNMGFSAEEAANQSVKLAQRAADMASVFNTDVSVALNSISAALRGEADPIQKFGVDVRVAALKSYALAKGVIQVGEALTAQQKVMLAVQKIYKDTNRIQGDFVTNQDTIANSARIATAKLTNLAATIGNLFDDAIKRVLATLQPIISNISKWVKQNSKLTKTIIMVVGGVLALTAGVGFLGLAVLALSAGFGALGVVLLPLTAVLIGVSAAAYVLYKNWGKVKEGAMAIYKSFKEFFQPILDVIWVQLQKLWAQIKTQLLPALKQWWNIVSPILLPALKILAGVLGGLLLGAITAVVIILRGLVAVFTKVFQWSVALGKYFQVKMVHAIEIATDGWNGLVDIFETVVDWLSDIIRKADKAIDTLAEVASFGFADTSSYNGEDVDDAVISPTGRVVTTHPKDWLIATKNPGALMAGGGGVTVNVYGDVSGEELVSKVEQGIMGRLGNNVRMSF